MTGSFPRAGDLDITFDSDGRQTTDFATHADRAKAVALQPDGKIVVVGAAGFYEYGYAYKTAFGVSRYNNDGTPDASFGNGGKVITTVGQDSLYGSLATAVAIQRDGKIVVGGYVYANRDRSDYDFALVRYNSDGTLDKSFSSDGKQTTDILGGGDLIRAITIQPDGKIIIPAGEMTGTFTVRAGQVTTRRSAIIRATLNGTSRAFRLIVYNS